MGKLVRGGCVDAIQEITATIIGRCAIAPINLNSLEWSLAGINSTIKT
jgi:hypothetical protein